MLLCWLQSDGVEEFYGARLFWIGRGHDLESRRIVTAAAGTAGIAHDGAQFIK